MPCPCSCPVIGTHQPGGLQPSLPGSPEGGHLVGPPKEKSVHVERDVVDVEVGSVDLVLAVVVVMEGGGEEEEDLPLVVVVPLL